MSSGITPINNQYVIDVEKWDRSDEKSPSLKRVLLNDAELNEKPDDMSVADFIADKYSWLVKSWKLVRVVGDGPNRFDTLSPPPVQELKQDGPQLTAVMELSAEFVQNLILAVMESSMPLGTRMMTRNQLEELEIQLMANNELWVIAT